MFSRLSLFAVSHLFVLYASCGLGQGTKKPVWNKQISGPAPSILDTAIAERPDLIFAGDRVIVGLHTHDKSAGTYGLLLFAVDKTNGDPAGRLEISGSRSRVRLFQTATGNALVVRDVTATLYKPSLEEILSVSLPPIACVFAIVPAVPGCRSELVQRGDVTQSATELLIQSGTKTSGKSLWQWYDTSNLSELKRMTGEQARSFHAVSEGYIVEQLRGTPELVSANSRRVVCDGCWRSYPLPNNHLLEDYGTAIQITDTTNHQSRAIGLHGELAFVRSSCCSPVFLFASASTGLALDHEFRSVFRIDMMITSIGSKTVKTVRYERPIQRPVDRGVLDCGAAISADGRELAFLSGSELRLYRLV